MTSFREGRGSREKCFKKLIQMVVRKTHWRQEGAFGVCGRTGTEALSD